jgi:hypothetical protein
VTDERKTTQRFADCIFSLIKRVTAYDEKRQKKEEKNPSTKYVDKAVS